MQTLNADLSHTCVHETGGPAYCWGTWMRPDGDWVSHSEPAQVAMLSGTVRGWAGSLGHACTLSGDGSVTCFGETATRGFVTMPTPVVLPGKASALTAGDDHTCALLENGHVACWGSDELGQLGDGQMGVGSDAALEVVSF
jgi:alpha-tubulin suppressor-like RCC1 family protein